MSGYLQRLVARAAGHGSAKHPAVYPMLGSVFSPPGSQIAGEVESISSNRAEHEVRHGRGMEPAHSIRSSAEQDEQPSPEPRLRPAFPQAQPLNAQPFQSHAVPAQTQASFELFTKRQQQDSSPELVQPARGPEYPAFDLKPKYAVPESAHQLAGNAAVEQVSEAKELPHIIVAEAGQTREQAPGGQYTPLFDAKIPPVERQGDRGAPRPRQNGRPYSSRRSPQAVTRQEGQDEIEIHIGRIEVTAVPPPVHRAESSRPPRPSPSLGEYLKRRNGRA
jgi:hypothetical protein